MEITNRKSNKTSQAYRLTSIGILAAILCILGPLSIPIGPVPISLTTLAIYISLYSVGMKDGTISIIIYLLLGFVGLPVFSSFSSGPSKLLGPTGGYLIGYLFMALIAGYFIDKFPSKLCLCVLGMIIATAVLYAFGTLWLAYQANMNLGASLAVGVIPFIPGDLFKIFLSAYIGPKIRNRLIKSNLHQT